MSLEHPVSPEQERFAQLPLAVVEPTGDKHFMISFNSESEKLTQAYAVAARKVLNEHNLQPFHQIGSNAKSGYQAFELWAPTSKEQLEGLYEEINQKAAAEYAWFAENLW